MEDANVNIASNYPNEAKRLRVILGITFLFFVVGLVAPIIALKKFVLIENTFSVLSGVIELLKEGQIFLFIVITGFSIVLPLVKIGVLNKLLSVKENSAANLDKYLHIGVRDFKGRFLAFCEHALKRFLDVYSLDRRFH